MRRTTRHLLTTSAVMLLLLLGLLAGGASRLQAQDATPGAAAARPIHIHAGTCPEVGDVIQPLADLTAPTGTSAGQATAIPGEYSYTLVPMALDAILAGDHAINAHESADNIQNYIACGDLGGVVDANGSLVVGLQERNDSGFSGIAVLTVNASDPNATDVSVFIAQDLTEAGAPAEESPEEAAENRVEVSLTEFTLDMPESLPAGSTTFVVTNDGTIEHSLEIEGQGIEEALEPHLQPGETGEFTVDLQPGSYEAYCPVGNHREQGMSLELTVTE